MTKNVTNYMLRQALGNVVRHAQHSNTTSINTDSENSLHSLMEKVVVKVCNNTLICEDGTEAQLVSPIPGLFWKCTTKADENGIITLKKPIGALIITSDEINYCLGIIGQSNEFEVQIKLGKNNIRVNNMFVNISGNHVVCNGVEEFKRKKEKTTTETNNTTT